MEPTLQSNFQKSLEFTLRWEGGYVNDPVDPGGETKFGISKRAYPDVNIKDLTREEAAAIYKRDYWDATNCDSFSSDLACVRFDCAVNCGIARALIIADGSKTAEDMIQGREVFYRDLVKRKPLMGKYLTGWLNRTNALRAFVKGLPSA